MRTEQPQFHKMASSSLSLRWSKTKTILVLFNVLATCVLLVLLGWNRTVKLPRQAPRRPKADVNDVDDSNVFVAVTHPAETTQEKTSTWTESQPLSTTKRQDPAVTVNPQHSVLGRVLERCPTEEAAKLAVEEDIYVSVKTTARYHSERMLPILQTWFQSLPADRVNLSKIISHSLELKLLHSCGESGPPD